MSGTLVGLGIGAMHYSGMAAMQTSLLMLYEPVEFALSIALAIALATLSLWIRFGLRRTAAQPCPEVPDQWDGHGARHCGMHYTGMAAVNSLAEPSPSNTDIELNTTFASLALSTFTITVTVLVAALNGLIRSRNLYLKMEDGRSRLNAILNTAVDGIITIDSHGLIQGFSHSAERLFGWTAAEVTGRNIKMLMQSPTSPNMMVTCTTIKPRACQKLSVPDVG